MEKFIDYIPLANEALPGTKEDSDIRSVYNTLASGKSLTTLDAVFSNYTVCLGKYISILRNKYNVPVKSEWVVVGERNKRVKRFWLEIPTPNVSHQ